MATYWNAETQQDEGDGFEPITCPECGYDSIRYVEDISCYREVLGRDPGNDDDRDARLVVDCLYKTDGYDDGTNPRFQCGSCCHEWPCPDGDEIDFV